MATIQRDRFNKLEGKTVILPISSPAARVTREVAMQMPNHISDQASTGSNASRTGSAGSADTDRPSVHAASAHAVGIHAVGTHADCDREGRLALLRRRIAEIWTVCFADVYGLDLTDPGAVRSGQVAAVKSVVPLLCLGSLLSGAILVALSWSTGSVFPMTSWFACLLAIAGHNVLSWWRGRRRVHTDASRRTINMITRNAFGFGVLWAIATPAFLLNTQGEQAVATVAILSGIIYGGLTIMAAPAAALTYILTVSLGVLAAFAMAGPTYALPILPPFLCYLATSLFVVVAFAFQSRDRVAGRAALARQDANIDRMLDDLEGSEADGVWRIDANGALIELSCELAAVLGLESNRLDVRGALATITDRRAKREMIALIRAPRAFRDLRVPVRRDGRTAWWSLSGYVLQDEVGAFEGMRGLARDVTHAHDEQDRMERRARTDALTGLANRFAFDARLAEAFGAGEDVSSLALHYLDLDGFKPINDTHGHAVGDGLLRTVAERLQGCVRDADFVARLGGDEFAIIQTGVGRRSDAERLAQRVIETVTLPCTVADARIQVGTSIGICLPAFGQDAVEVCEAADVALYAAKAQGRGNAQLYSPIMQAEADARGQMERDLRRAFERGELALYYQPILEAESRRTVAFEALLRWPDAPGGPISPAVFLPLAEETGLMREIGDWILQTACRHAAGWPEGAGHHAANVMVNLSITQLREPGLVASVKRALAASGLDPARLHLELSEHMLPDGPELKVMLALLREVRALGVHVGLDDFGTGVTSLATLREGVFDQVKLDQALIASAQEADDDAAVASAIIALARSLRLRPIAEGVERQTQLDWTRMAGCAWVQGFLFGAPVTARQAGARLAGEAAGDRATRGAGGGSSRKPKRTASKPTLPTAA